VYWTVAAGKESKNPSKSVVAPTFEKAKTYIFDEPLVWDREVGGSNPLAPTININNLRLPTLAAGLPLDLRHIIDLEKHAPASPASACWASVIDFLKAYH
jgi:hypothetical protein